MTNPMERWTGRTAPALAASLSCRSYGTLDVITDSERRSLRPIGMTAHEAAVRTGRLLVGLLPLPGIRIFQGVRSPVAGTPPVPHVVSVGTHLVFVESVAWPAGRYAIATAGQIHCDGVYTGQSVQSLIATVRHWQETLPADYAVSALVVVHSVNDGELVLPCPDDSGIGWARPSDAVPRIRSCMPPGRQSPGMRAVAALVAATIDVRDSPGNRLTLTARDSPPDPSAPAPGSGEPGSYTGV